MPRRVNRSPEATAAVRIHRDPVADFQVAGRQSYGAATLPDVQNCPLLSVETRGKVRDKMEGHTSSAAYKFQR